MLFVKSSAVETLLFETFNFFIMNLDCARFDTLFISKYLTFSIVERVILSEAEGRDTRFQYILFYYQESRLRSI
jgi:hypothetical protein